MNLLRFLWRARGVLTKGMPAPYRHARRRPATMLARGAMEAAQMLERRAPFDLKELAMIRTASLVGCTW